MQRLKTRSRNTTSAIQMAKTVTRLKRPPVTVNPPVSAETFALANSKLGIVIPKELRWLYENVGDGGFGPGYGLFPLLQNFSFSGRFDTIVSQTFDKRELSAVYEYNWSNNYLVICSYGCTFSSCIDISVKNSPVFFVEDTEGIVGELQSDSFLLWLEFWLDGRLNPYGEVLK